MVKYRNNTNNNKVKLLETFKPGVSNLFDRRAKCTNSKLVGGQIEMPNASRGRGMGRGCPPDQPTRRSGGAYLELEKTHLIDTNLSFLPCNALRCTVFVIVLYVRLSVCLYVTLVDCVHMVRPTIMISSPYGSPIILVSGDITFIPKFEKVTPSEGVE